MSKKIKSLLALFVMLFAVVNCYSQLADDTYLDSIKKELKVKWPNNRTINFVFHGHSVPSGYTTKGVVDRVNAYPFRVLKKINDHYPYSVVNTITTTIGGEQSEQGAKRFKSEVLNHRPDVIFIDYALNDRSIGLKRSKVAWEQMIQEGLEYGAKIILMTPTPDLREDISSEDSDLAKHSRQIVELGNKHGVLVVDNYTLFKELSKKEPLIAYMSQNNHINQKGHQLVADEIYKYFNKK